MDMPSSIVLIVCKTVLVGAPDPNAAYTGHENRDWDYSGSVMHCKRIEAQLYDSAEAQGADPQPFNEQRCQRAGLTLGPTWDAAHRGSAFRFWRVACPVPVVDTETGKILAWKMPECPTKHGTVICEQDSAI